MSEPVGCDPKVASCPVLACTCCESEATAMSDCRCTIEKASKISTANLLGNLSAADGGNQTALLDTLFGDLSAADALRANMTTTSDGGATNATATLEDGNQTTEDGNNLNIPELITEGEIS